MKSKFLNALKAYFSDYFSLKGYIENQDTVKQEILQGISFRGTNIYILILATIVACLGLNTNSTAVIIGAMLISPLMGPIIGIGMSVGIQDFGLLKRSLRNLMMAAGFSVIASTIYFLISPVSQNHSELLARTSPTIYDVLIAFVGGAAGIVGMNSRSKGNVIPGVAIATALMPPLCTVGYGLATWQYQYFLGAAYLFIINSIFIALATFVGVKLMHFNVAVSSDPARSRKVRRWVYALSITALLPSIYLTYNMLRESRMQLSAERFVAKECQFAATQVLQEKLVTSDGVHRLDLTLIGRPLNEDSLHLALSSKLPEYGLKNVQLNIIQGSSVLMPAQEDGQNNSITEVYNVAQKALLERDATIDSLRQTLAGVYQRDTIVKSIAPELKVVFPELADISVSRNIVCDISTGSLDTLEVAMVSYRRPMTAAQRRKLSSYLEARLGVKSVTLVAMP